MFSEKKVIDFQRDFQRLLQKVEKPTLVVNREICQRNIQRMAEKTRKTGTRFRPHFKTHQSAAIGEWFREAGVNAITVSSVEMAEYFTAHGWEDITIAFPVNWREIERLNRLAEQNYLNLLIESLESVRFLTSQLKHPVRLWIKIDTGYHRTGISYRDVQRVQEIIDEIERKTSFTFEGLLTHSGNSYRAKNLEEIQRVYQETVSRLQRLTSQLHYSHKIRLSIGDTPTCSVMNDFSDVDEIRPGNFVFYDLMQLGIGSCQWEDIACMVACPVVAIHPHRQTAVIYGGAVHLSKEFLIDEQGRQYFGEIVEIEKSGWGKTLAETRVVQISQEHGIVHPLSMRQPAIKTGEVVLIAPVHSCLAADLISQYYIF